ncbi:MAG: hypothetical protein QOF52_2022, partial [Propionibacteriaceae bacterium]|nr:hypothetical protein [Propionibacteriaceae bacterium]
VLQDANFQGSLAVELDLMAEPWEARTEEENVAESIAYLKQIGQKIDAEAASVVSH